MIQNDDVPFLQMKTVQVIKSIFGLGEVSGRRQDADVEFNSGLGYSRP